MTHVNNKTRTGERLVANAFTGDDKAKSTRNKRIPTMRQSVVKTMNAIRGTDFKANELKSQKVSEGLAMFAVAHNRLAHLDSKTAKGFLNGVKKAWKSFRAEDLSHPLFRALDSQMKKLVEAKKVSAERAERILRYSLGHANISGKVEELSDGKSSIAMKWAVEKGSSYIDRLLNAIHGNRNARQSELDKVRAHVYGTNEVEKPLNDAIPAPVQKDEGSTGIELPSVKDVVTEANDMAWYPESKNTGKACFYVPEGYSDEVLGIEIYDQDWNLIERLNTASRDSDGRLCFYSQSKGSEFGNTIRLILRFVDGTILERGVNNPNNFEEWSYSF
ncbi:MAG: hypothetical protein GYA55_00285 [SAR324 cluster bacterium]|uniref:Uncharacterized protein n=1 Tax=SAR324 cluster bacterium TaxID=2024889 RepID=A0A7X9FP15_9DELT|nr:hypothetical protein [SAR324 cluster bacterium]